MWLKNLTVLLDHYNDYEDNEKIVIDIINTIFQLKIELEKILDTVKKLAI
jgi:hypothetical protein